MIINTLHATARMQRQATPDYAFCVLHEGRARPAGLSMLTIVDTPLHIYYLI